MEESIAPGIFSTSVRAGNKTYFFDVKQAKGGKQSKYLQITETRLSEGQRLRSSITIFAENIASFGDALTAAREKVG